MHENYPYVPQKTFLLWMSPSLHVEKSKERLEDAIKKKDLVRIKIFSGRDEEFLRRQFTKFYQLLVRPGLEEVNIELDVIENIGDKDNPVLRTITDDELKCLIDT